MQRFPFFFGVVAALASMLLSTAQAAPSGAAPLEAQADISETYTLAPGDKLKITVFNVVEITGEYSISAAGNVALPLVGVVTAVGRTTDALSDAIRTRLAGGYVNDPNVSVEVIAYRPFYILGQVNRPGEFPYVANLTIEQAIAAAGGYTLLAARHRAFLRRAGEPEQVVKFGKKAKVVYVLPGDTIRIGERFF